LDFTLERKHMHPSDQVVSPVAIVQTKRGLESNRAKRNEVDANPGRHLHVVEMGVNRVDLCVWGLLLKHVAVASASWQILLLSPFSIQLQWRNGRAEIKKTYVREAVSVLSCTYVCS
jgi:hypothetical protein